MKLQATRHCDLKIGVTPNCICLWSRTATACSCPCSGLHRPILSNFYNSTLYNLAGLKGIFTAPQGFRFLFILTVTDWTQSNRHMTFSLYVRFVVYDFGRLNKDWATLTNFWLRCFKIMPSKSA